MLRCTVLVTVLAALTASASAQWSHDPASNLAISTRGSDGLLRR